MHFLYIFLLCTQSITATTGSGHFSDASIHSPATTRYRVEASDPAKAVETEAQLKSLYGDDKVVFHQRGDKIASWTITSDSDDITKDIEALELVHLIPPRDSTENPELVRRDIEKYLAFANLAENVTETEEFLRSKMPTGTRVAYFKRGDHIFGWWNLALDLESFNVVKGYKGIESIRKMDKADFFRALPSDTGKTTKEFPAYGLVPTRALSRRADQWVKQKTPGWAGGLTDTALKMDSQYQGANVNQLQDFVHVPGPGKGITIYVIDRGVKRDVHNYDGYLEFHPPGQSGGDARLIRIHQSTESKDNNEKEADDENGHGTAVASKALGLLQGVAKAATLVIVKIYDQEADFEEAWEWIANDIEHNDDNDQERKHKSVVIGTWGFGEQTPEQLKNDPAAYKIHGPGLERLSKLGVPVVQAAGNRATQGNREDINHRPAIFMDDTKIPLIVVGAVGFDGHPWVGSQGQDQLGVDKPLTIYAPGVDVVCQDRENGKQFPSSGTSWAAPQVAGLIATYLAYPKNEQPWNSKTGVERVVEIKKFLTSSMSSWERQPGANAIWNGATRAAHDGAVDGTSEPPGQPLATPPNKTKALTVILQKFHEVTYAIDHNPAQGVRPLPTIEKDTWSWRYFATNQGVTKLCDLKAPSHDVTLDKDPRTKIEREGKTYMTPPYPTGDTEIKNLHGQDCRYKNDGTGSVGMLWCKDQAGKEVGVSCQAEDMKNTVEDLKKCEDKENTLKSGETIQQHAVVLCEW